MTAPRVPMSRLRLYIRAISTGYALLALNTGYQLALVPIGLRYLGIELFGLWALCIQVGIVLQLADVGMLGALGRILMNHKDDKTSTTYSDTFYTLWMLLVAIGTFMAFALTLSSDWLCHVLAIQTSATIHPALYLAAYGALYSVDFMLKPIGTLLFIQQRSDIANVALSIGLIIGFATSWILLAFGWGIWALFTGNATMYLASHLLIYLQCVRLRFIPPWHGWASLRAQHLRNVFRYGKDRFAVSTGHILLQATPSFLITRLLGLESMALWTVGVKMYQLCLQLIMRFSDFSYPALAEMFVRKEIDRLRIRFRQLLLVCGSLAILTASLIMSCNHHFVALWTGGRIPWPPGWDLLMGLLLICHTLPRLFYVPASISTELKGIRFAYLLEVGFVLILLLAWPASDMSIGSIITALCIGSVLFTLPAFLGKTADVLSLSRGELIAPIMRLFVRALIPATLFCVIMMRISLPVSWLHLVLLAGATGFLVATLLVLIPDVRSCAASLMSRAACTQKNPPAC